MINEWYILLGFAIASILISCYAQGKVSTEYNRYSKVLAKSGITAKVLARQVLDIAGLKHIEVKVVSGTMTDYFDAKNNILALSEGVSDSSSVSALGIAMHEVGHALQYKDNYFPIKLRKFIGIVTNFMSKTMWILLIAGIILDIFILSGVAYGTIFMNIALILLIVATLFELITIPVERNASKRAYALLQETNALDEEEMYGAKKVLSAAGLTYVASFITSVLNLLRILMIFGRRK